MRTESRSQSHAVEARRLLRACRHGSLATLSQRLGGYPFATVVPYMADLDASTVILVSRLAEHTKNIEADSRTSLMVHEPSADIHAAARLTVAGTCRRIEHPGHAERRYLRLFPAAADLLRLDFDFYRIHPVATRYIGGFGSIHWVSSEAFLAKATLASSEEDFLAHINSGSVVDLRSCCRHFHATEPTDVRAVALDCDGMDLRADDTLARIPFTVLVEDAEGLREALEKLNHQCRA